MNTSDKNHIILMLTLFTLFFSEKMFAAGAPTIQSSNIILVANSTTVIKISCTIGNGTDRLIVINNSNSFTNPVDNSNPAANTVYSGSGEQVVYNGTGNSVQITVPSSSSVFYIRVFEFQKNGSETLYNVNAATDNPKQCRLESISTTAYSSVRLNKANLGATIGSPAVGTISERGIFWSTSSPVSENSQKVADFSSQVGAFTLSNVAVTRNSTIYFRGYVKNESGTTLSAESSFSNIPVFTGTGNWENASLWNVQQVPGLNGDLFDGSDQDCPVINGNCTLTADNFIDNLTIQPAAKLVINKAVQLKVDGTITNQAGAAGLVLKAIENISDESANATLIFGGGNPQATVEMFSKASWNLAASTGNKYSWQYFGIPVENASYNAYFTNAIVREWDESVIDFANVWVRRNNGTSLQLSSGATLTNKIGYEIVQSQNTKYSFGGTLYRDNFELALPRTSNAFYPGQSILSNPYTAAMDITNLFFDANTEAAVYLFNTGKFSDWAGSNGGTQPGSGPGTYTVSTPGSIGLPGVPTQIPSMQGFLVKAISNPGYVSFPYSALMKNSAKQRVIASDKTGIMIDLIGTNYSDRMWILDQPGCTNAFDNRYDGRKMMTNINVAQLYGKGSDGDYQIMAVNDLNQVVLGFNPGDETSFKLRFTHQNTDTKYNRLYLVDIVANTTVDISANNSEYSFTAQTGDIVNRFKIVSATTSITELNNIGINVSVSGNNQVVISNLSNDTGNYKLYDLAAKLISTSTILPNNSTQIPHLLQSGIYILHMDINEKLFTKRIVIK